MSFFSPRRRGLLAAGCAWPAVATIGIAPLRVALGAMPDDYGGFRRYELRGWHPEGRGVLVARGGVAGLLHVETPLAPALPWSGNWEAASPGDVQVVSQGGRDSLRIRDPATKRTRNLSPKLAGRIDEAALATNIGLIAITTREHGAHALRFIDAATGLEQPRPPMVPGLITGLSWRPATSEIGFTLSTARAARDVFSYDIPANRVTRWTNGNAPNVNTSEFAEPRVVRWDAFTALVYEPPHRFAPARPVLVELLPQDPEAAFIGRYNHLLNDLGIALVRPFTVPASQAPAQAASFFAWLATQARLDGKRVLVAAWDARRADALAPAFGSRGARIWRPHGMAERAGSDEAPDFGGLVDQARMLAAG